MEGYFLGSLSPGGPAPQLVLVAIFLIARQLDLKSSLLAGLWGGLWLDITGLGYFGLRSLWLAAWGAAIYWLGRLGIDLERRLMAAAVVGTGSLIYNFSLWLVATIDSGRWLGLSQFLSQWVVEAMLSGGLVALLLRRPLLTQSTKLRVR